MNREIQIGDQVRVGLPPDQFIYDIEDIDKDGWIYIVAEEGNKQGILVHQDLGTRILGLENVPYTIEFIPKNKPDPQPPKFYDRIEGLTGDSYLDFQIIKNLDERTLSELTRSTSEYIRRLAYKGKIYQEYGDFVEDYGLEHDFERSYRILDATWSNNLPDRRETETILKSNDRMAIDYLFNKIQYPLIGAGGKFVKKWMLDWLESHNKLDLDKNKTWSILASNNLIATKWLLDHGYKLRDDVVYVTAALGQMSMILLLNKYGYHPTVDDLDMALHGTYYNLADWMMSIGVEPNSKSLGPLMVENLDLAKKLSSKYNIIPDQEYIRHALFKPEIHNICDILDWIIGFIQEYPELLPGGNESYMVINSAMENDCPEIIDQLLQMGYTPSNEGIGNVTVDKVIEDGRLETAKVLSKYGYRPSDQTLKTIRDLAFGDQIEDFYPRVYVPRVLYKTTKSDFINTYQQIYELFV